MNWLWVGAIVFAASLAIFGVCLARRQWTRSALAVGLVNLAVVGLHSVAPIRGCADPDYAGFSVGFFRAEQGPLVTLIAGSIFLAALALDRRGAATQLRALRLHKPSSPW
ncbi:MAG: hypothetical protein ACE5GX_15060 [Thermoanaerobaculia bacterium]